MQIGLFFGSFNPFHIGHKAIASYIAKFTDLDQVWFIVSPHNPLKKKKSLLDQYHRLQIIRAEIDDIDCLKVSDVEFSLPQPSFTIDTLTYLSEKFKKHHFSIIMGSDNINSLHKWKNFHEILNNYSIMVYPRPNVVFNSSYKQVKYLQKAPVIDVSASFIRESIKLGKDISFLVPDKAWKYIDQMNFYK
jgi:nicotinate-nucleotide adenylyltransferase|tara:strand:- start:4748 stop:5317 length:570 start_codon:yes stop_codon:yes gene_type:complete